MPRTSLLSPDEPATRPTRCATGLTTSLTRRIARSVVLFLYSLFLVTGVTAQEPDTTFAPPASAAFDESDAPMDLEHLRLALRFDLEMQRVQGDATLHFATFDAIPDTLLLFGADLVVDSVHLSLPDTTVAGAFRMGAADSLLIAIDSVAVPYVPLDVRLFYTAQPRRGLHFSRPTEDTPGRRYQAWSSGMPEDNRHWFPVYTGPKDALTVDLFLTYPATLRAYANGRRGGETAHDDDTTTTHFFLAEPAADRSILLAVGEYDVIRETHSTAVGETPLARSIWSYPEHVGNIARTFGRTPDVIRFFADEMQTPFPWPSYAQVVVQRSFPEAARAVAVTTFSDRVVLDERAALDVNPDALIAREIARQWFGTYLSPRSPSDAWMLNGMAAYLSALFAEHHLGEEAFALTMREHATQYLSHADPFRHALAEPATILPTRDALETHKGAGVLYMLHRTMGDDVFWKMLEQLLATYGGRAIDTSDFLRAVEGVTFEDYDAFFDQWVTAAGHPELDVSYAYSAENETLEVTVAQRQQGSSTPDVFDATLVLDAYTLSDTFRFEVHLDRRTQTFALPLRSRPRFLVANPTQDLLADISVDQPTRAWVSQLRYAADATSRLQATRALTADLNDPALLIALRNALQSESSPAVRTAIIETMGQLPPASAVERALLEAGTDEHPAARVAVLEALRSYVGVAGVHDFAFQAAQNDPSYRVQAAAVLTLAHTESPSAFDVARSALVTPSYQEVIRRAALAALPVLDLPVREGLPLGLTYSQANQPAEVRVAAARYLHTLAADAPAALNQLIRLLDANDRLVHEAAVVLLGRLPNASARQAFESHQDQVTDPMLRAAVEQLLEQPDAVRD